MKTIGNILWFIFGGIETAVLWFVLGLVWCATLVGIRYGVQCFRYAKLGLWPMGKIVNTDFGKYPAANVIWLICGGSLLAFLYLVVGFLWCASILGIPFGLQSFKFSELACFPFGAYVY